VNIYFFRTKGLKITGIKSDEAKQRLKQAIALDQKTVQQAAVEDSDLKPLWESLGGTIWKRE